MAKLIRITTVPMALRYLLPGQLRYMKQQGFDVLMISAEGPEKEAVIKNEDCRHIAVNMTRQITPFKDLACLWQLIKIFRKEKPDIVHSHTPKAGLLGMLAAKICGVKIRVHTVAGLPLMVEKGAKYQLLLFIEKLTYWAANQVWPNSGSLYNFITEKRLTSVKKMRVISKGSSNGINLNRFSAQNLDAAVMAKVKEKIQYNPALKYLLCVGRLVKDKGIAELVNVFCRLQPQYQHLRLILVGEYEAMLDPLPQETMKQVKENTAIVHTGWDSNVEYYMTLASLFVFPSHREGFPNVLLQAAAMCTPIICSAIPGNVDIVEDRQTGLLFATGDETAMQQQITYALDNNEQLQQMAVTLFEKVHTYYRQENLWAAIHAEYVSLLNKT
jgi:glycosyltransferase involved in cell wall biosynthesis